MVAGEKLAKALTPLEQFGPRAAPAHVQRSDAMQNPYTTCDETRSTARLHHHYLTKLSRDNQNQPLCQKCTKEQSVERHSTATTTAPEALCKLPVTKRRAFQEITNLAPFVAAEEIPAPQ